MKTTIIATALTLIAIGAVPAVAQSGRTEPTAPAKPAGSGATATAPADPKVSPPPKATADDPKVTPADPNATAAEPATPAGEDPKAADGQPAAAPQDDEDDPDLDVNLAQPDYTIIALPTTLRLPKGKFAFRVTHRFGRPLDDGNFGDLAADLFRVRRWRADRDSRCVMACCGARRSACCAPAIAPSSCSRSSRSSDRRSSRSAWRQNLTMDGTNNFQDSYSPGIGLVVSREIGKTAAVYFEPTWVNNTNTLPATRRRQQRVPARRSVDGSG